MAQPSLAQQAPVPQAPGNSPNLNLQTEYQEVCSNFRTLTEIRFKLLALLPISTAAGVALTVSNQQNTASPLIGVFGLLVTVSAAFYNERNDQLYNALVSRAAELERRMGLRDGAFAHRPRPWLNILGTPVSHSKLWWIYWGSMAAWIYTILPPLITLIPPPHEWPTWLSRPASWVPDFLGPTPLKAIIAGGLAVVIYLVVAISKNATRDRLRETAKDAVKKLKDKPLSKFLKDIEPENAEHELFPLIGVLAGVGKLKPDQQEKLRKSLVFYLKEDKDRFYWEHPGDNGIFDTETASQLVGLVSDISACWIYDIASGRRHSWS